MLLPSYEDATSHDHWRIVSRYIPFADLRSATLVCKRWHEIFAPHLWGNPASHFAPGDDAVFSALANFKRILPRARFYVRQMTHTLRLPPAHAEFYQGPHADWLLMLLRRLPNLQCLIVDGLPFLDHAALLYTRRALTTVGGSSVCPAEFSLRYLNASACPNCTHTGLSEVLLHLTALVHLDLSYTPSARHPSVLESLSNLRCLQSLKLRGVGLTDSDLRIVGESTGLRLRSLDVRDNLLTDEFALILLEHCFKYAAPVLPIAGTNTEQQALRPQPSDREESVLRNLLDAGVSSLIDNRLASGIPHDLASAGDSLAGITHLFLSGNRVSEQAVSAIVRTSRVQMLDIGAITVRTDCRLEAGRTGPLKHTEDTLAYSTLVRTLARFGSSSLSYLRVHHNIVTGTVKSDAHSGNTTELCGTKDAFSASVAHELGMRHDERYPGSHAEVQNGVSTTVDRSRIGAQALDPVALGTLTSPPSSGGTRAESQSSTRIEGDKVHDCQVSIRHDSCNTEHTWGDDGISSQGPEQSDLSKSMLTGRPRSFSESKKKREGFMRLQTATSLLLTPAHLPMLDTLVLTDVPGKTHSSIIADRLIEFVRNCAAITVLARDEARVGYQHPPGRSAFAFECDYVRSVVALQRIVIQIKPPATQQGSGLSQKGHSSETSIADRDCEALSSAADGDFTFFAGEDPELLMTNRTNTLHSRQRPFVEGDGNSNYLWAMDNERRNPGASQPIHDVIAQLTAFRRDRREMFERAIRSGFTNPIIDGYWPGEIRVERPHLNIERERA